MLKVTFNSIYGFVSLLHKLSAEIPVYLRSHKKIKWIFEDLEEAGEILENLIVEFKNQINF